LNAKRNSIPRVWQTPISIFQSSITVDVHWEFGKKTEDGACVLCSFVLEVSKVEASRLTLMRRRVPSIAGCRVSWEQERLFWRGGPVTADADVTTRMASTTG
jgi:hypothetical protein